AWHWRAWRRAARSGGASLREFYQWLRLAANAGELRSAVAQLGEPDRVLAEQVLLEAYARRRDAAAWPATLAQASRRWRRAWRARRLSPDTHALPAALNSCQARGLAAWPSRPEKGAR
ncbi:hypothetical protein LPZ50_04140, partial [Bordetella petrii]|nr:hypothetical protein [Bordetella petrii]